MNRKSLLIKAGAITAIAVTATVPSLALQNEAKPTTVADTSGLDDTASREAAAKLAAAVRAELAKQPATASSEDMEGTIVFVISQGTYSDAVIASALDTLDAGASEALHKAIENVRLALLKKKLNRGTAALGNGGLGNGAGIGNGGGFSAPGVSTGGGGSSNYSG